MHKYLKKDISTVMNSHSEPGNSTMCFSKRQDVSSVSPKADCKNISEQFEEAFIYALQKVSQNNKYIKSIEHIRTWQKRALYKAFIKYTIYIKANPEEENYEFLKSFVCTAFPGSGKTVFALMWFIIARYKKWVDRIIIISPGDNIKTNWQTEAKEFGIELWSKTKEAMDCLKAGFDGRSVTYSKIFMLKSKTEDITRIRNEITKSKTLLVLDEAHHTSTESSWGNILQLLFGEASSILLLSGTPFRTDNVPLPFVPVVKDENGMYIFKPDEIYSYAEGVSDGVLRKVVGHTHNAEVSWKQGDTSYTHLLSEVLNKRQENKRWHAALDPKPEEGEPEYMNETLVLAIKKVKELRASGFKEAQGLVVCENAENAEYIRNTLMPFLAENYLDDEGFLPEIALSQYGESSADTIKQFKKYPKQRPWIVAVRQVSEGVNIPNIAVIAYASNVTTSLFMIQVIGRMIRRSTTFPMSQLKECYIFLPDWNKMTNVVRALKEEEIEYGCVKSVDENMKVKYDKHECVNVCEENEEFCKPNEEEDSNEDVKDEDQFTVHCGSFSTSSSLLVDDNDYMSKINPEVWKMAEGYILNEASSHLSQMEAYLEIMSKKNLPAYVPKATKYVGPPKNQQTLEEQMLNIRKKITYRVNSLYFHTNKPRSQKGYQNPWTRTQLWWYVNKNTRGFNGKARKLSDYSLEDLNIIHEQTIPNLSAYLRRGGSCK